MSLSAGSRLAPPTFLPDATQHRRLMAQWMREAHQGHLGNVGNATLGTGTAATVVIDFRVGPNSFIGLMPTTTDAAVELAAGGLYVSNRTSEAFTITHISTVTARTLVYCVLG